MRRVLAALLGLALSLAAIFFSVLGHQADARLNTPGRLGPPANVSERAAKLHRALRIVDLHADSLLWDRDLLERHAYGAVDVPRLVDGNVAIQTFTIVTSAPFGLNIDRNDDRSDMIQLLAAANRWPPACLSRLLPRALHQCALLGSAARRSGGKLTLVLTAADLRAFLERRTREPRIAAGWLGVEGAHALDGDLDGVDRLYDAGVRMVGPAHFFDNDIGGSSAGVEKIGLTAKGRELVARMEERRMIVDLAHASHATIADVLQVASRPVIVSHTGVRGSCDNNRNLTDEELSAIARKGGLVGIGFFPTAVCGRSAADVARALRHAVTIAGVDHVALGSDWDGATSTPFDAEGIVALTDALVSSGWSDDEIGAVMGENAIRFLQANLP
ncbi:MAG: dipeptidase [Acidobacteriota bacterium]